MTTTADRRANPYALEDPAPSEMELKMLLQRNLAKLSPAQLTARLERQVKENKRPRAAGEIDSEIAKRILDTTQTVTNTTNILARTDLEQTILALFLKSFPYWDRIAKAPTNGLRHTWNVKKAVGTASASSLLLPTELSPAQGDVSVYDQFQMVNMATLDTLRGVSLKEELVVKASGMTYSPETEELTSGVTALKQLAQMLILQGNSSIALGTASNESGAYQADGSDGLRLIMSGTGTYNNPSPGAVIIDQDLSGRTISQAINVAEAKIEDRGGMTSLAMMSSLAYTALMAEQADKQRVINTSELVPGVRVPAIATGGGDIPVMRVPGGANALGHYLRTSDAHDVEDIYLLSEKGLTWRYLGTPDLTVIEIPMGVDLQLSRRFIIFMFGGLQVADNGFWQAKVRIPRVL